MINMTIHHHQPCPEGTHPPSATPHLRGELLIAEAHAAHRDPRAALLGAQRRVHTVDLEAPQGKRNGGENPGKM